jgi:hypothetical protein
MRRVGRWRRILRGDSHHSAGHGEPGSDRQQQTPNGSTHAVSPDAMAHTVGGAAA